MNRLFFLLLFIIPPFLAQAQLKDDFSDGDFINNPTWSGSTDDFTVNSSGQLQLNAQQSGQSFLHTPLSIPDSTFWEFYVKMDFAPSTSNLLLIYLQVSDTALSNADGYYLSIGESGSTDAIRIFRKDKNENTLLVSTVDGSVASEPVEFHLRVERSAIGAWKVKADYNLDELVDEEISFDDDTYGGSERAYFGFACQYTNSRIDKFFFDDIQVDRLLPDVTPPILISAQATSSTDLEVLFNEALETAAAQNPDNYAINQGIGTSQSAQIDPTNPKRVHIVVSQPLTNAQSYTLTVSTMTDLSGNEASAQQTDFTFIQGEAPEAFDVLINEFMADPAPSVGLPEAEYVELYNRSEKIINLNNLQLASGSSPVALPDYFLFPDTYVVVTDASDTDLFSSIDEIVGVASFPTLSNTIDEISLETRDGVFIHYINYNIGWYKDSKKAEGGYALELINPEHICDASITNWSASESLNGGTPGKVNSIWDESPDDESPILLNAFPLNATEIILEFDEGLDEFTAVDISNYSISNGITISRAELKSPEGDQVKLFLNNSLSANTIYELNISSTFTDCLGNAFDESQKINLGLPEAAAAGDVLINEILFNPYVGGVDFVELYNASDKIINIGDLSIGNFSDGNTSSDRIRQNYLLFPDSYVALTVSPTNIKSFYDVKDNRTVRTTLLPAFPNEMGNVTLVSHLSPTPEIIDAFDYQESFHFPLLDDEEGVSLERISPLSPTQGQSNWQSAAKLAGYATPGYQNSQSLPIESSADEIFSLSPTTFSPDQDGVDDFLTIQFNTDQTGYAATIKIFDAQGRLIKDLVQNEQLPTSGSFKWDGTTSDGIKARIGIYIIWIELFNLDGSINQIKKTCVLAGQL